MRSARGSQTRDCSREDAITDHLQLPLTASEETQALVERFVARVRSHVEPPDASLL